MKRSDGYTAIRLSPSRTSTDDRISIVLRGATLAFVGVAAGTAIAALGARTLQTFLFGVSTRDPLTFAAVGAILIVVAALASLIPALRAVRVSPITALRE